MNTVETIRELRHLLAVSRPKAGVVEIYGELSRRLSKLAKRERSWGWRYVLSVSNGTVQPSRALIQAINKLAASMDGKPTAIADVENVTVTASRGSIQSGAYVSASSRLCQNPVCRIVFVPRVPWQKYCGLCKRSRSK